MAGVIPNVEEERILTNYNANNLLVRLYSNNVTPNETSTLASFTEVTGGGYAFKDIASGDWVYTQGDPTFGEAPPVIFEFTGTTTAPGTIYGYYLVDSVTNLLKGAERFAGSIVPLTPIAGSVITINPRIVCN